MFSRSLIKLAPGPVKHPLIACTRWYWDTRQLPEQSSQDMRVLKDLLMSVRSEVLRVWEWGAGKSTIYYPKFLISKGRKFEWHAVDNSTAWYEKCQKNLSGTQLEDRVHLYCREFPAFWQLPSYSTSNPVPPQSWNENQSVAEYIKLPTKIGVEFDVMIIDGRYRRRCLLAAKEALAPGGTIFLHDAQRQWYHSSLSEYGQVHFSDTGKMPGTKQKSTIAVCQVDDDDPV